MKIKTLHRSNFDSASNTRDISNTKFHDGFNTLKDSVNRRMSKNTLQVSLLYILSILSITCWIISLRILPFGDMFQFLLGSVVLSVNLLVFKYTKI